MKNLGKAIGLTLISISSLSMAEVPKVKSLVAEYRHREETRVSMNVDKTENEFYDYALIRVDNLLQSDELRVSITSSTESNTCEIVSKYGFKEYTLELHPKYFDILVKFTQMPPKKGLTSECTLRINGTHRVTLEGIYTLAEGTIN